MGLTIDPSSLIGNALSGIIGAPIVIGLLSAQNKIPSFVIGTIKSEKFNTSVHIPTLQLQPGNLFTKSAVNGGKYSFEIVLTADPDLKTSWLSTVATVLQQVSGLASQIATFGSVVPNLSAVTASYASSQLATLHLMKNSNQPLLLLNTFITLGSISQTNPNLSSSWIIDDISGGKEEAEAGGVITVSCTEVLTKRDSALSLKNLITNFGNEIIAGNAGDALGALF